MIGDNHGNTNTDIQITGSRSSPAGLGDEQSIDIHFGIGGVVTFKNAKRLVEVVEKVPTERLLLETDAPYLAPTPYRGQRNEPSYLEEVIKKFSQIKNIEENELSEMLISNTKRVFKI